MPATRGDWSEYSRERQPLDAFGALSRFDKLKAPSLSRGLSNRRAGRPTSNPLAGARSHGNGAISKEGSHAQEERLPDGEGPALAPAGGEGCFVRGLVILNRRVNVQGVNIMHDKSHGGRDDHDRRDDNHGRSVLPARGFVRRQR